MTIVQRDSCWVEILAGWDMLQDALIFMEGEGRFLDRAGEVACMRCGVSQKSMLIWGREFCWAADCLRRAFISGKLVCCV